MEYRLMFTQEELSVINDCLMVGQYGRVAPVINSINAQIQSAAAGLSAKNATAQSDRQGDGAAPHASSGQ
jgi:hypothetical protein